MTKQSKIIAATEATIQQWPLKDTYLSEHNPRGEVAEDDQLIFELAQTIIASGLIHNLSGLMDEAGKVGIVAGGRRWRALQLAVESRPDLATIPVKITDDLETALSWAMLENRERVELDKVDEIVAYGKSRDNGLKPAQIAKAYCVTEAHVRQRLALCDLPSPVLDALKCGDIGLGEAKVFATCDDEAKVLEVLERAQQYGHWGEYQIKQALLEDKLGADCRAMRYVGLDAYKAEGGTLTTNLFNDDATVNDIDLLDELFTAKLVGEAAKFKGDEQLAWVDAIAEGNCYVHEIAQEQDYARLYPIAGELTDEQQARYDALDDKWDWELSEEEEAEKAPLQTILNGDYSAEQRAMSGAIVYVDGRGALATQLGFVRPEDYGAAVEAGFLTPNQHSQTSTGQSAKDEPKPPYSQKFTDDLTAIRLAAVQTALLQKPELVLDLLAFGLAQSGSSYYSTNGIMAVGFSNHRNKPEGEDSGFTLAKRLGGPLSEEEEAAFDDAPSLGTDWDAFENFRTKGKKDRNAQITQSFARSLKTLNADFMAMIEAEAGASVRAIWTPNAENCFKRMKASQLEAIYMGLLDLKPDSAKFKAFAKAKKGEKDNVLEVLFNEPESDKANGITKDQRAAIDAWVPEGLK